MHYEYDNSISKARNITLHCTNEDSFEIRNYGTVPLTKSHDRLIFANCNFPHQSNLDLDCEIYKGESMKSL